MSHRILIIDDEKNIRTTLARGLDLEGFTVEGADAGLSGLAAIAANPPDLVLLDLKLPDIDGLTVLERLRAAMPEPPAVVMMSGHGTLDAAIRATRLGALDFLEKPIEFERLLLTVKNALRLSTLDKHVGALTRSVEKRSGMVGNSRALNGVLEAVRRAAPTKARVLVTGESGVGKELVAKAIHDLSKRADGPFVKLNCAAMTETLVDSELFGHEKGAFSGADKRHLGRFERADGGTLFLDEVGNLSAHGQAALLRVLQTGEFERLGSTKTRKVKVRLLSATNTDLLGAIARGQFREDLYYRLNVIEVRLPPLRRRPEDIVPLAEHFLRHYSGGRTLALQERAQKALVAHSWPGNVRELSNRTQRAAIVCKDDVVTVHDLGLEEQFTAPPQSVLDDSVIDEGDEAKRLERVLARHNGVVAHAAAELGLSRQALYRRLRRHGLELERRVKVDDSHA